MCPQPGILVLKSFHAYHRKNIRPYFLPPTLSQLSPPLCAGRHPQRRTHTKKLPSHALALRSRGGPRSRPRWRAGTDTTRGHPPRVVRRPACPRTTGGGRACPAAGRTRSRCSSLRAEAPRPMPPRVESATSARRAPRGCVALTQIHPWPMVPRAGPGGKCKVGEGITLVSRNRGRQQQNSTCTQSTTQRTWGTPGTQ